LFSLPCSAHHRHLHSFPTRRSSDLPAHTARNKLLNAIGPALADDAGHLSTWFLHDPDPWSGNRIPHGELRRIARCVHERREVERSEEHTSELQSRGHLVCRLLLEKK